MNRLALSIAGTALALLAAITLGLIIAARSGAPQSSSTPAPFTISSITLGISTDGNNAPASLTQRSTYDTTDQLALRVTANASAPYELQVRLLNEQSIATTLEPNRLTLQPGTDGYCCWQIAEAGTYTLQIIRPDGVITTLPLTIRSRGTNNRNQL